MARKPTLEDAYLLALFEAGEIGLESSKWFLINRPSVFQESWDDFIKMRNNLLGETYIHYTNFVDGYKLTEKGKEKAHRLEGEIGMEDYISLITRVSPREELRKRMQNVETFIISVFFAFLGFLGLSNLKNINLPSYLPSNTIVVVFILFLIFFVIGFAYSTSNFFQIVKFWVYYSIIHGKTRKQIFIFYTGNEKIIKTIWSCILLPLIILLIIIYGLGMNVLYAIATIIVQVARPYMFRRNSSP